MLLCFICFICDYFTDSGNCGELSVNLHWPRPPELFCFSVLVS